MPPETHGLEPGNGANPPLAPIDDEAFEAVLELLDMCSQQDPLQALQGAKVLVEFAVQVEDWWLERAYESTLTDDQIANATGLARSTITNNRRNYLRSQRAAADRQADP